MMKMQLYELTVILGSIGGFCVGVAYTQMLLAFKNRKNKDKIAEYYRKNKDKIAEYRRKNKDKIAEYRRKNKKIAEYCRNNKDKIAEYRRKNKDKIYLKSERNFVK